MLARIVCLQKSAGEMLVRLQSPGFNQGSSNLHFQLCGQLAYAEKLNTIF